MATLEGLQLDVRLAVRQFRKQRTLAVTVVATLALGVGTAATFFSILDTIGTSPLPYHEPDRLTAIDVLSRPGGRRPLSLAEFTTSVQARPELAAAVGYVSRPATLSGPAAAEQATVAEISGDLFGLLGVPIARGRSITEADEGAKVAVIAHDLWTRVLGSDSAAVGSLWRIDGQPHTIVGIAPPGFQFPAGVRAWVPLDPRSGARPVGVVGRIHPRLPLEQAPAVIAAVAMHADATDGSVSALRATPLRDAVLGTKQRDAALVLLVASGLVLVLACVNLASLVIASVTRRRHELAVRAALGGTRWRVMRQLAVESLLLALAGGALGALLAQWGVDVFIGTLGRPGGAEWMTFAVNGRVLTFAFLVATAAAIVFGTTPALTGSRIDIRTVLQQDRGQSGTPGPRRTVLRQVVIGSQVALSLALLAGSGAVVVSALEMDSVDPGFTRDGLLVVSLRVPDAAGDSAAPRLAFLGAVRDRLRRVEGVSGVAAVSHAPLVHRNVPATTIMPAGWNASGELPRATFRFADADYLALMRIPLKAGRTFTAAEIDRDSLAALVNESMARRYWPGQSAIGQRFQLPGAADPNVWRTVIGVVGDVAQRTLPGEHENQMYFPLVPTRDVAVVLRTTGEPAAVAADSRRALQSLDPDVAVTTQTIEATYEAYARDRRLQGLVLAALGLVGACVAALGVHGIMSLSVAERRREFAIRSAVGGSRRAIMRLILGNAATIVMRGIGGGLVVGAGVTTFLSSIFVGVSALDPRVFGAAATFLATIALLSSWWPARTAAAADHIAALKD